MKKLLTFFSLLLLIVSCTKEVDVSQGDTSGEAVSFTATVVGDTETKVALKSSWADGDKVALFFNEESTVYCFDVAEDGTMSGHEFIVDRDMDCTYTAFYPYDASYTTRAEYEAACTAGEVDCMKAVTVTSGKAVELQFSHTMAVLSFSFKVEGSSSFSASLALDGDIDNAIPLTFDEFNYNDLYLYEANYFVESGTDISSAALLVEEQDGATGYYILSCEDGNILESGKQYPFSYGEFAAKGTEEDPYLVWTPSDMRKVGTGTDGWGLSSSYFLVKDIDLGSVEFTAIGTYISSTTTSFTGTFDGGNKKISGLCINQSSSEYQGLFGYIMNATIKNLSVSGNVTGKQHVGGIIGRANGSTIVGCNNAVDVTSLSNNVGGIVGYATSSTVDNCDNTGDVTGSTTCVGGIVGYASYTTMSNCRNEGTVSGLFNTVGGVVGYINDSSTVSYSYNAGGILAESVTNKGGVVGYINDSSTVSYCYYDKDVAGDIGAVQTADSGTNYCGLTTAMMKGDVATEGSLLYYFDLGGSTSWTADTEGVNDGYPVLVVQVEE
ncbi:MAG: GLUG motif-containing protein [Rikenellaceae bacterium]